MPEPDLRAVEEAFRRARVAVADHTDTMAAAGATWREETLTELVLANAHPPVRFADFTRGEEAVVGADWLWWWVAQDGTTFGALVQAKNLTFTDAGTPKIDHRHAGGRQLGDLLETSDALDVPALYAIYMGGLGYRGGWPCDENPPGCLKCIQRAITMLPAVTLTGPVTPTYAAERACESGIPLETLNGCQTWWHPSIPPRLQLTRDLHAFLNDPQHDARAIAREVFAKVSLRRLAEFGGLIEESPPPHPIDAPDQVTSDRVFTDLPVDEMHNGVQYFEHVLRGLRRTPPGYVLDVLNGTAPPPDLVDTVRGVAVVSL